MIKRLSAYAYSHSDFDKYCKVNGWNDDNVENIDDRAFISIVSTKDCLNYYGETEYAHHWFKQNHNNVLNIEFDDITEDETRDYYKFLALTEEQAQEIFTFIESNVGKHFVVHCTAGISRSGAIVAFILDMYQDEYVSHFSELRKIRPNNHVLTLLKRCYYQKYDLYNTNDLNDET